MKVATWNINSVRLRAKLLARFLREHQPDVVALQETKVENGLFPRKPFEKLGYVHQAIHGQKGYHGVAVLSKIPFRKTETQDFCREKHARHLCVTLENGVELHDFYVPAGADVPDPDVNPKFAHKLNFLGEMARQFEKRADRNTQPAILVGDLNVAPLEHDVWSHKQLLDVVSHTPVETNLLGEAKAAFEWTDVTREFVPHDEKSYSWWSYRAADWQASNRGRRLDHIWVSPALKGALTGQEIVSKMRGWQRASDHVPVVAEIEEV
ncbi:MAG: exodeoxyribonuclease III [Alphaproteobacteria bacterium]|nr:exodeoxyribonuclease III [Alphaproteobacteria bacterium]MBL6938855.1 exodeoxyribonuclease III [Alphaproteobacteria bacterium]MBL7099447.1 exodeoxyribonuclease III [Alphaproteobacteria bacterium]